MDSKQNNIDSNLTASDREVDRMPQIATPETNPGFTKTRAVAMLASLAIVGLLVYEKMSPKENPSSIDTNDTPIEQIAQTTPDYNKTPDTNNSNSEKKNPSNDKYGDEISINNYDKYIPNLPSDRIDSLNSTLYNIVKSNSTSGDINITDANIRDGSAEYNYDKATNINSGSFIVDIPSIKQSYVMSYRWSSDKNNVNLPGYTATAACLPTNEIIYSNFDCKDDFEHSKNKTDRDPILGYLPYSTFNYSITANTDKKGSVDLNVEIFLYSSDTRDGESDNSIKKYKTEVIDWIKSKKLNPDDYSIQYSIN